MEVTEEEEEAVVGENSSRTDARGNWNSRKEDDAKIEDTDKFRVLSVDKFTVEKIVLESSNGSRQVFLTKNESSKKLSLKSEPGIKIARRSRDERKECGGDIKHRVSLPEGSFTSELSGESGGRASKGAQSKLPLSRSRRSSNGDKRIKPIKLTKSPSIGSIVVAGFKSVNLSGRRNKTPPKVPVKPVSKKEFLDTPASPICSDKEGPVFEDSSPNSSVDAIADNCVADRREIDVIGGEGEEYKRNVEEAEDTRLEVASNGELVEAETLDNRENENLDRDAQDRLEKSQSNIEVLQQNLGTKINATTAQEYKEELFSVARANCFAKFSPAVDPNSSEDSAVIAEVTFDQDFLEKHNLDRRLKIEEKRLLETDIDYASEVEPIDGDFGKESVNRRIRRKPRYSKRVSEVEKRWSGEFLESRLEHNSSESSKSSYVEEFGSVSSRESVLEDRDNGGRLLYERKRPVKFTESELSIDAVRRRASEEALEGNSTVSTVDSDSCLEDRIKAVQEDIDKAASENREDEAEDDTDGLESDHREGGHAWEEFASKELDGRKDESSEIHESGEINKNAEGDEDSTSEQTVEDEIRDLKLIDERLSSTDSIGATIVIGRRSRNDGYAKLIREFAMEAGSSKAKKEEKQKKKLGLRRLLPGFFSPKDSRKDYGKKKKKEPKEPKRHDERHFARYQQNGNYTRSPDTMNLNEDIKRNVKLDNSLNGSIIEERLDEIKRELFPDQGPITSTPDHLAQQDDDRNLLRDRSGAPRSYTTNSSLSSIAPDDRWHEGRIVHLGISPDFRKYEQQRQKREETDHRRYGQLERKHSLQEANHASRSYFFQRNHGPSGRISAPPTERYLVRPRAIHPVDRPLPAIPYSRVELSNYENYLEDEEEACERMDARGKNEESLFAPVNDTSQAGLILKSVSAQVKITRQPIVNQNQRAPLVGRSQKYPSPGSSQKSADYADSSCTPNSSQKSEFSVTSSKSGEYYLHSPRSTGSPNERAFEDGGRSGEGIYENEQSCSQSSRSPVRHRVDERIYDETPPSPSHPQNCSPSSKTSDRSPEDSVMRREEEEASVCQQNYHASPIATSKALPHRQQRGRTCRSNENAQRQDIERVNRVDVDATQSQSSMTGNQRKIMMASLRTPSSPGARASLTSRRSQSNDQILIASPKRDVTYEGRISRPSNESASTRNCGLESPVPMTSSPHCITGVAPLDSRIQDPYGDQNFATSKVVNPTSRQGSTSSGFPADIPRPEPIYGQQRVQRAMTVQRVEDHGAAERQQDGSCQVSKVPLSTQIPSSGTRKNAEVDDRVAWVQGRASSTSMPKSPEERSARVTREAIGGNSSWPGKPVSTDQPVQSEEAQRQSQQPRQEVEIRRQRPTASNASHENLYVSTSAPRQEQHYEQRPRQPGVTQQRPQLMEDPIYVQRASEPIYGQRGTSVSGPLSPSKLETRQHLEAFYWQQKALEAHKNSAAPPMNPPALRQVGRKIDLPEVREAVYWQQLKKLDEEQQRRIYKQNLLEESLRGKVGPKCTASGVSPATANAPRRQASSGTPATSAARCPSTSSATSSHGDPPYWDDKLHRSKVNPAGKPPLMHTQKGQNQPVLIVRPQQAIQERREIPMKGNLDPRRDPSRQPETQRSKSASPHFHRPDGGAAMGSRKTGGSPFVYEEQRNDVDGKPAPPPIFKRGSLVGGDSVEYGSTMVGPKRVSFSNQSATGSDVQPTASWPTKHGNAPEPPTRRHRGEDSVSDTDSVFSHQDRARRDAASQGTEVEYDADRPLPPLPAVPLDQSSSALPGCRASLADDTRWNPVYGRKWPAGVTCENENGRGDAAEAMQRALGQKEEEWNPDGKGRQSNDTGGTGRGEGETGSNEVSAGRRSGGGGVGSGGGGGGGVLGVGTGSGSIGGGSGGRSTSGGGGRSRDEPRRHTLGGDHQPSLHHQQFNAAQQLHPLHPHHLPPPHGQYGTPPTRHTTMDLEMGTKSRQRKSPLPRGYPPPSSTMLFDDDPGIMSEVETSSTGFRRGGKQRSSLPVVRTPSKTLERPLGLVFLQYRNETKRALLPNEITSIDTVKALFVRSFPKQLTMEYLDSPHVKVYIHDSNKDMFYELEDLRSHLRDIRDRSVLRLFESSDGVTGMPGPLGVPGGGTGLPPHWEDQSYFSEPEFDSEYQHQHIHKSKTAKNSTSGSSGYYMGGSSTLPRGGSLLRAYSPATSSVVAGPNATPTQPKALTTPGGGGVPPAKPLRSYQCGKSPLGSLGGSARFSRDSSVSLYSIPDRLHGESGYMSSPERGGGVGSGSGRYPPGPYSAGSSYEDPPYYSQYSGTVTPVIDEEASDTELLEESYSLYGVKPPGRPPSGPPRSPFPPVAPASLPPVGQSYDATRIRVDHMERQLANLTGLVQKALTHAPHTSPSPRDYLQVPAGRDPYARAAGAGDEFDKHSSSSSASLPDDSYLRTDVKPPKLGKDKSVSFEKSVSFSDEPPDMNSPKQHSPQHAADTKPTKPAIKSSTLPRMSSQERDRHKPTPPPKPAALVPGQYVYRDLALTPEMYNQLRGLQKKAKDLRQEVRNLRRMSQTQAHTVRETIRDTFITIRAMLLSGGDAAWCAGDTEKIRLTREEDLYKQEMIRLEKDLTELESTVEELRGNVINRKTRVNMSDVENMALILSKSSKTVADLKVRFPSLQEGMKGLLSSEMEKVVREEKFLKEEPERLESALRRCKKLTGTLVTLKRLASVQEQRLPNAPSVDAEETPPITPTSAQHSKATAPVPAERTVVGSAGVIGGGSHPHESSAAHQQRPENALDALLDELQTFSRPSSQLGQVPGMAGAVLHQGGSSTVLSDVGRTLSRESTGTTGPLTSTTTITTATTVITGCRAPCISDIGRKGSVDSSSGILTSGLVGLPGAQPTGGTLRRLHSYPSSSDTDTSPPITRLQVSLQEQPSLPVLPQGFHPGGQKPPVPERNAELLQLASARRVPPPPPPRTSSRSPLASPTSPQLPPRNHSCNLQGVNATLRRPAARGTVPGKEGKPPMALPPDATAIIPTLEAAPPIHNSSSSQSSAVLSTSNSSSCESVNSQEGLQSKRGRQEQLEQRHQELLRKQKALQEQYARLQQLQRNAAGLTTVPPAPPDLLKKTGSESNLLAKMGLGLSAATSGSLTSLTVKPVTSQEGTENHQPRQDEVNPQDSTVNATTATTTIMTASSTNEALGIPISVNAASNIATPPVPAANTTNTTTTTTNKIYETDIL